MEPTEVREAEIIDTTAADKPEGTTALVPGTLGALASKLDRGKAEIEARASILETARKAAIRMTSPEDWLLFRDRDGRVIGYLQDCGCDRVRDVFGIEVFDVQQPEKVMLEGEEFMYIVRGSGRAKMTGQALVAVEGGRASTDDYIVKQIPPLKGAARELAVRKAARANLDGNLTRELSGLKAVPLEEIQAAFAGDPKKSRIRFREGRGFGSQKDRQDERKQQYQQTAEPTGEKPLCPMHKVAMLFRAAGKKKDGTPYPAFWGCPHFKDALSPCKETMMDKEWKELLAQASHDEAPTGEETPEDAI